MKIYFAGSIRGGRGDADLYAKLINHLKKKGEVLTEFIVYKSTTHFGTPGPVDEIFKDDMRKLSESDVVVAEVTTPSLGVGFEIAEAIRQKKRVLCLYRLQKDKSLSAMIAGNGKLTLREYTQLEEATAHIDRFLESPSNYK